MRLINEDDLLKVPNVRKVEEYDETGTSIAYLAVPVEAINNAPTIEAEPVRHGKWIVVKVDATETKFQCSECGREVKCGNDYFMKPTKHVNASYPYCHCGAKMDLEG